MTRDSGPSTNNSTTAPGERERGTRFDLPIIKGRDPASNPIPPSSTSESSTPDPSPSPYKEGTLPAPSTLPLPTPPSTSTSPAPSTLPLPSTTSSPSSNDGNIVLFPPNPMPVPSLPPIRNGDAEEETSTTATSRWSKVVEWGVATVVVGLLAYGAWYSYKNQ